MKIVVIFKEEHEAELIEGSALTHAFATMLVDIMNQTKSLRPTGLINEFSI